MPAHAPDGIVSIQYEDMCSSDASVRAKLLDLLGKAYGHEGLGILTVAGVPAFAELREKLLPLTAEFVALPENVRESYTDPASSYSFGWSHGKEAVEEGRLDSLKGSFYANPMQDNEDMAAHLREQCPSYCRPNIWPEKHLPQLKPVFQALGQLMALVGEQVAGLCDQYMRQQKVQPCGGSLLDIMSRGRPCYKARLLHYFPPEAGSGKDTDVQPPWCGWHTDHSSLTGLASAMYMKHGQEVPCPDSAAGLYIRDEQGRVVQVRVPADQIAFQMGEAMQIHSGGLLRATMHCVKGGAVPASADVTRHSFAVFMQPRWDQPMDLPSGMEHMKVGVGQWRPGLDFGQFSELTVQHYYTDSKGVTLGG